MRKMWVDVSFQFEGLHCWPNAPDTVAHLRSSHRHVFHCDVSLEVFHGDREVEFQLLKQDLQRVVSMWDHNLGAKSCEHMADQLIDYLEAQYCKKQKRAMLVSVSEDGENGATIQTEDA